MALPSEVVSAFPNIKGSRSKQTSWDTPSYNCIAWAAETTQKKWWPDLLGHYWPPEAPQNDSVAAFVTAFKGLGYKAVAKKNINPTLETIALYGISGRVKHAARKLKNGRWTSKLGDHIDIEHKLKDLEGATYGKVIQFLQRK